MTRAALTIDVEDWFHVENLASTITRDQWDSCELRVERSMHRVLDLLAEAQTTATCFVLGWVAERCPALVRAIAAAGHEVACHGYGHELVTRLTPGQFRQDVRRAQRLLEDITGVRVRGYRAPCFSITDRAIDELHGMGFDYDSSAFPVAAHDRYGRLRGIDGSADIVDLRPGLAEVCISTLRGMGRGLPWGGGGYFRLLPYPVFRGGVRHILAAGRTYVFYIHPWEFDPGQPRVGGLAATSRLRHYVNLDQTERRFERLLRDFRWTTISRLLEERRGLPATHSAAHPAARAA